MFIISLLLWQPKRQSARHTRSALPSISIFAYCYPLPLHHTQSEPFGGVNFQLFHTLAPFTHNFARFSNRSSYTEATSPPPPLTGSIFFIMDTFAALYALHQVFRLLDYTRRPYVHGVSTHSSSKPISAPTTINCWPPSPRSITSKI